MPPENEAHPHPTALSDFILGSQDGLVNVLGILLGLVAAHVDAQIIIVAGLSALAAESLAMAAVAYTSTASRLHLYRSERERELREMHEVPELEREEVRVILRGWGWEGAELEEELRRIEAKPKAWLDLMMAFELNLSYIPAEAPRRSAFLVGFATVIGHFVPLIPFFFATITTVQAAIIATILSAITLFGIGIYEARVTSGSLWRSGVRMTMIGLASGFAGLVLGHFAAML
ncbi:MAG TPA: VIT1/CCC1 transporter family protein [Thermoplasmata archaeon]|nr:VIT1/CCC1 transporter family protein [Thermoplasmata archaeon]